MAIGGPLGSKVDPQVRSILEQLLANANGLGTASTALFGTNYRWAEGPYPSPSSPICALLQFKGQNNWQTVAGFKADGSRADGVFASYNTSAAQSLPNNSVTIINFSTKEIDDNNAVTTGASWGFKVPTAGLYEVSMSIRLVQTLAIAAGTQANVEVFLNGNDFKSGSLWTYVTATLIGTTIGLVVPNVLVPAKAGDVIDIRIFQNTGAAMTLNTIGLSNWVQIKKALY